MATKEKNEFYKELKTRLNYLVKISKIKKDSILI